MMMSSRRILKNRKLAGLMLVALVALAACQASRTPPSDQPRLPITLGQPFRLNAGQTAALNDTEVIIGFAGVDEDSRCPKSVECFWAGQAKVRLSVVVAGAAAGDVSLTLPSNLPSVQVKGYDLKATELEPYPATPGPINPQDYAVTLVLTKSTLPAGD